MKHLLLLAFLFAQLSGQAQVRYRPDTLLVRQAYRLCQDFNRPGWQGLAATLRPKPRPIWSYVVRYALPSQLATSQRPAYYPVAGETFSRASGPAVRRFNNHMYELGLERRQSDYERLSNELLLRATKVRKLPEALPVLLFAVDSAGRVQDVDVDKTRSSYGLTKRSRKIILQALRESRFRALEARYSFSRPRPFRERLARLHLGPRLNTARHTLFDWAVYKRQMVRGRCGEIRYVKRPWFGLGKVKLVRP